MSKPENSPAYQFAVAVVHELRKAGFIAYFAGGCVRDQLLDRVPKDYDVATNALPDEVRRVFGRRRTIAIGASFGVITVVGPKSAGQIEVATFRHDGTYSDGRHPDHVVFSSPEEDAQRRDFTINGMFFDPVADEVIDYVGGQADLHARLIRAIGDPLERISEDRLRMLRAVRFAATYGFQLEPATLTAIQQQHAHINSVSNERITNELERMLLHRHRRRALELLSQCRLLASVLPEVAPTAGQSHRWSLLLDMVHLLEKPTLATVLAALWGDQGAALSSQEIDHGCRRMKTSNDTRNATVWISKNEPLLRIADQLRFSQLQPLLIHAQIKPALQLAEAITQATGQAQTAIKLCEEKLRLPAEQLSPEPLITGEDLASLGVKPGPVFARVLRAVRNAQLDGLVRHKAAAMNLAQQQLDNC